MFHFHKWIPISAKVVSEIPKWFLDSGKDYSLVGERFTHVLHKCRCGKLKTEKLTGDWKLEEIK